MKTSEDRSFVEAAFENAIWHTRWAVLVAVICSVLAGLLMFYIAGVDTYYIVHELYHYAFISDVGDRSEHRAEAVAMVVEVIDIFLLAVVLMIFGLGLYELYISKIDHAYAEHDEASKHLLSIRNLDDLKSRLGKVIMMILIVKFFQIAIGMYVDNPMALLMFAAGVIMIALALMLTELAHVGHVAVERRKSD